VSISATVLIPTATTATIAAVAPTISATP
jgi:hypothetical protein